MEDDIKKIEDAFRNSTSSDELFDAFQKALSLYITDIELYKILLANPALSPDEIKMFAEKLLKQTPNNAFELCMWTAKVFENYQDYYRLEDSIHYYRKAISYNPTDHESLLQLLKFYNYEIEMPANKIIIELVEENVSAAHQKSKVYYAFADLYRKVGNKKLEAKYLALAEYSSAREQSNF